MNRLNRWTRTLTAAALLALAAPAGAFNTLFLTRDEGPVRKFNDTDMQLLRDSVQRAMAANKAGSPVEWRNAANGHHGSVTVMGAAEGVANAPGPCRHTRFSNTAGELSRTVTVTLCQLPDGDWKVAAH